MSPPAAELRIEVTAEDIEAGDREDSSYCAIAVALCRQLGWDVLEENVQVDDFITVWDRDSGDHWFRYAVPPDIAAWIRQFDHDKAVAPVIFTTSLIGEFFNG